MRDSPHVFNSEERRPRPWKTLLLPNERGKKPIDEVGFCIAASCCCCINDISRGDDVVSLPVLWHQQHEDEADPDSLCDHPGRCQFIHNPSNSPTVRPQPLSLGKCHIMPLLWLSSDQCLGRPHQVFSLHVGSPPYRWLSNLPRPFRPGHCRVRPRRLQHHNRLFPRVRLSLRIVANPVPLQHPS